MSDQTVATSLKSYIKLNDGVDMPLFGLGMSKSDSGVGGVAELAVTFALQNGYKLIDTAARYGNEEDVGRAVNMAMKNGMRREDIFIVTKLWHTDHGRQNVKPTFLTSLKKLNLQYVDLYLMHSPMSEMVVETYQAMLDLKSDGLVRSVGVSNFGVHHLEGLVEAGKPLPSVNQIELQPWKQRKEIAQYCHKHGIAVMGYSPLARAKYMDDPYIIELSKKYHKSYAQILIRWSVQKGYITIPKSSKPERITENCQVFDFELSREEMATMDSIPDWTSAGVNWNPTVFPWQG